VASLSPPIPDYIALGRSVHADRVGRGSALSADDARKWASMRNMRYSQHLPHSITSSARSKKAFDI
jgi:hypothetical protein